MLLLPFSFLSACVRTKSRSLEHFADEINKYVGYTVFIVMGCLILLIQIFSISIAGLVFFICMLALFIQRFINFQSVISWLIVLFVQVISLFLILANFITSSSLLASYQQKEIFRFCGINALNNFTKYNTERGYFISLILLFCVTCVLQRIFIDTKIWKIANKILTGILKDE
jgi:hypothetical protein